MSDGPLNNPCAERSRNPDKGRYPVRRNCQEEGTGALKGMQYYVNHHPELDASISVDGPGFEEITYEATGIQTYEINFHGVGGHACGAFAKVANRSMRQDARSQRSLRSGSEGADDHVCGYNDAGRQL